MITVEIAHRASELLRQSEEQFQVADAADREIERSMGTKRRAIERGQDLYAQAHQLLLGPCRHTRQPAKFDAVV